VNKTILSSPTNANAPLGVAAFDSLRAEDEPWLPQCYQPPTDFPLMASWRSALIFGEAGSGKTGLRLALERTWSPPGQKPPLLLVRWAINIAAAPDLTGTALVQEQVDQILDVIARALLKHLAHHPDDWEKTPTWAHHTLAWFSQHHLLGDPAHHVASLEREVSAAGLALLQNVITLTTPDVLYSGAPPPLIYAELIRALNTIGLDGMRILVSGLEPWMAADPQRLVETLHPFLSALGLFEHPRFAYTMILPARLPSPLWSAGSVARRRVDTYPLKWSTTRLQTMVERRLALAMGETDFPLKQLGSAKQLQNWLQGCGGHSPRGWLEAIRPFLITYLEKSTRQGKRKSLTKQQCISVQKRHPPRLFVDPDTGRITVGWREIANLQRGQQAMLKYLYHHRGQVCTRERLYRAYLDGLGEPADDILHPAEYAGRLDNAVYRLRQAIEPDSANPVLLVTSKGEGFRLDNAW